MNQRTISYVLIGLAALALLGSGVVKILNAAEMGEAFGNPNVPYILAVTEFLIVAAIAIPRTRMLGLILGASYFGGAIAVSWLMEGEFPVAGIIVNTILYAGAWLYRPSLADGRPRA